MFENYMWKSDILSKDAGRWPASLLKKSLFYQNQIPGLSISGTLVKNGLNNEGSNHLIYDYDWNLSSQLFGEISYLTAVLIYQTKEPCLHNDKDKLICWEQCIMLQ